MNIMFFLKPKAEVCYLYDHNTMIRGLEKMQEHRYAVIPVIDKEGKFVGTVSQGDFLWKLVELGSVRNAVAENILIKNIMRNDMITPLGTDASIDDVLNRAENQNFVPVVDGRSMFMGIVTRRDIMRYLKGINGLL